ILFWWRLQAPPESVILTGAIHEPAVWSEARSTWAALEDVSIDGRNVTVKILHGARFDITSRLEIWDARTGKNETPPSRDDTDWKELRSVPGGGRALRNELIWEPFRQRLVTSRSQALDDLRKTGRPVDDSEADLFPGGACFSPDGQLFAYVIRNGLPLYVVSESLGEAVAVDDVTTGKRVAVLPGVTSRIIVAPDSQTAVSVNYAAEREGEQPRLILW